MNEELETAAEGAAEKRRYRVLMPIGLESGEVLGAGSEVELDLAAAKAYCHALIAVEREDK